MSLDCLCPKPFHKHWRVILRHSIRGVMLVPWSRKSARSRLFRSSNIERVSEEAPPRLGSKMLDSPDVDRTPGATA